MPFNNFFSFIIDNFGMGLAGTSSNHHHLNNIVIGLETIIIHKFNYSNFYRKGLKLQSSSSSSSSSSSERSLSIDKHYGYTGDNICQYDYDKYYDLLSNIV